MPPTNIPGMRGPGARNAMMRGKAERPKNMTQTIQRLQCYLSGSKTAVIAALIAGAANTLLTLAASYMLRPIINTYIVPSDGSAGSIGGLLRALAVMLAVYVLAFVFNIVQMKLMLHASQSALVTLRKDLFGHMQKNSVRFFDTNSHGDLMSRFTNDVDAVGEMLNTTIVQFISGIMKLIGTLVLMFYTNVWLALVTVFFMPLMAFAGRMIIRRSRKYYVYQAASIGRLNGYIEETISGQKVVKVFGHEKKAVEDFCKLNYDLRDKQQKAQFYGGIMGPVVGNIGQANYSITAMLGGLFCILFGFDVGGVTVFVTYARQFSRPINELSTQMNTIFSALAGAERVFGIMDTEPEADFGVSEGEKYSDFSILRGEITLENVSFGYTPDKPTVSNIALHARQGEKIAFVGSTGAGKTTIINLLNRFYEIDEGSICIDGVDIRNIRKDVLRRNIALVLQDTHLFTGTVMENIRYGRQDASDEEVYAAAKTANADYFIRRLRNGYNTVIEGDGSNLSQGQRQLLNIARAALSKAPILILDEATSSVDTRTERQIQSAMDKLMQDRTTLVIAHRLSTIRNSDRILVLENGRIVEGGNHEQLMEQNGRYYELYTGKVQMT